MNTVSHRFICFIIVLFAFLIPCSSGAQEVGFGRKGVVELSGSVSFNSITPVSNDETGEASTLFSIAPQIGYFVTDGFEIGLSTGVALLPGIAIVSPPRGDGTTMTQLFFTPAFNVITQESKVYPFIEGQIGYTSVSSGNESQTGFSYGARGGVKVPVVEHLIISTSAQYLVITLNPEQATRRSGYNYFSFGIGVGGYF